MNIWQNEGHEFWDSRALSSKCAGETQVQALRAAQMQKAQIKEETLQSPKEEKNIHVNNMFYTSDQES